MERCIAAHEDRSNTKIRGRDGDYVLLGKAIRDSVTRNTMHILRWSIPSKRVEGRGHVYEVRGVLSVYMGKFVRIYAPVFS